MYLEEPCLCCEELLGGKCNLKAPARLPSVLIAVIHDCSVMYQKGAVIFYPVILAIDCILYVLLRAVYVLRNCWGSISLAYETHSCSTFLSFWSGKVGFSLPPHVAISCPQISSLNDQYSDRLSREDAVITIVRSLLLAGVRHVSVHDPAQRIPVQRFCNQLCKNLPQTSIGWRTDPMPRRQLRPLHVSVSNVSSEKTLWTELTLDPPPRVESLIDKLTFFFFKKHLVDLTARLTRSRPPYNIESAPCIEPKFGLMHKKSRGSKSTIVSSSEVADAQLTLIQGWVGHMGIVSAARRLAEQGLRNGCSLSVQEIVNAIDDDPSASVLPSEPDVLIVFPANNAPPLPVLHGFPFWQLRLTQIMFAKHAPNNLPLSSVFNMIATTTNVPKRFGR